MESREIVTIILLILLIVCAIAVNVTKNLLQAVIIYMSYSSVMCIIWILMESPDLAITEAAVGAGISGILFLVTLKKIREEGDGSGNSRKAKNGTEPGSSGSADVLKDGKGGNS